MDTALDGHTVPNRHRASAHRAADAHTQAAIPHMDPKANAHPAANLYANCHAYERDRTNRDARAWRYAFSVAPTTASTFLHADAYTQATIPHLDPQADTHPYASVAHLDARPDPHADASLAHVDAQAHDLTASTAVAHMDAKTHAYADPTVRQIVREPIGIGSPICKT